MKIIVDVMSGDNAPSAAFLGAVSAYSEYGCEITLVGDSDEIGLLASTHGVDLNSSGITVEHSSEIIGMDEPPMSIRNKKDSSMVKALSLLSAGKGDAMVSAGNTGALYTGASIIVSRIKGFRKAAIATVLPFSPAVLLVDAGANITVTDENLEQFAIMGSAYMEKVMNLSSPRVGLLNNGTERTKGSQIMQDTYCRLEENEALRFVGNIESRSIPYGVCDILVTDGFSGNIVLKYTEGLCAYMLDTVKNGFDGNPFTKASGLIMKKRIESLTQRFSFSEYGGAPLLGISKPVIKAHGSSDANAIKHAVKQAIDYADSGMIEHLSKLNMHVSEDELF